jgi:hypothetical protein
MSCDSSCHFFLFGRILSGKMREIETLLSVANVKILRHTNGRKNRGSDRAIDVLSA